MHGYQPIEKKAVLWSSAVEALHLEMIPASIAVGVISGLLVVFGRLHLGLPGHKALFWMIPVITMRLKTGCKVGAIASTTGVIITTFSLQGHLAGGPLGLGMIFAAGFVLDIAINFLQQRKMSDCLSAVLLSGSAMCANLLCLIKKLAVPNGIGLHLLLNSTNFWFRISSYAFFGFVSGTIAWVIAYCISKHRQNF